MVKLFKLDANTSLASRGKFARICVDIDLCKPLVSKVHIGDFVQVIEYEAIHTLCFECGVVGHRKDNCPKLFPIQQAEKEWFTRKPGVAPV